MLFAEGVRALSEYEKRADRQYAQLANFKLERCVATYPQDVLPRFYFGIIQSYLGGTNQKAAIEQFERVLPTPVNSLRFATRYNLAVAHLRQYTPEGLAQAQTLFEKIIEELRLVEGRPDARELRFQTWIDLLYTLVHQRLWTPRKKAKFDDLNAHFDALGREIDRFGDAFREAYRKTIPSANQIEADYYNVRGTYFESRAWFGSNEERKRLTEASTEMFKAALAKLPDYAAAKANLARVYLELLDRLDEALALLTEIGRGTEERQYARYLQGQIYNRKEQWETAVDHLKEATGIPNALRLMAQILQEHLNRPQEARIAWQELLKEDPEDAEAVKALEDLAKAKP